MSERWRCFVAVPIGEALRARLAAAADEWKARPDLHGLRWTDPDGWHVTLAFLGAVETDSLDAIRATIANVAATSQPAALDTGGVGGFPSTRRARVAWYGVADPEGRLAQIAARLRGDLDLGTEGPLRAHVTLARARGEPVDLSTWRRSATEPSGVMRVTAIELLRSHLGQGPARYEVLGTAPLRVPAGV